MAFEKFIETGKGFDPKASIRKNGQIGLNKGAVERFNLKNFQFVLLAYDRDRTVIGIEPLNEPQKGAKKALLKSGSCTIGAKNFLDYFNVPYQEKTKTYDVFEENGMICFQIK